MEKAERIAILTGATSGIGRETAKGLAAEGYTLVLPVRNMEKGLALKHEIIEAFGHAEVDIMFCRLDALDSIRSFVRAFREKYDRLDLLINNAGIWEMKRRTSQDGIEMNFAVNHLAPFQMTYLLLDMLKEGPPSRVINVSSTAHRFAKMRFKDLEGKKCWNNFDSYGQSKLANILFTNRLAREFNGNGSTANSLHPGVVSTHLFDGMPAMLRKPFSLFMISPAKGAETTLYLATAPEVQKSNGAYFVKKKKARAASHAMNEAAADKLWEISKAYCL